MVDYEKEFDWLSRFATGHIADPENKKKRFIVGLRADISGYVHSLCPASYTKALDSTLAIDIGASKRRVILAVTQTSSQKSKAENDLLGRGTQ